jgi:hypothetical protein
MAMAAEWDEITGYLVNERGLFSGHDSVDGQEKAGTVIASKSAESGVQCLVRLDDAHQLVVSQQEAEQAVDRWMQVHGQQAAGVLPTPLKGELFRLLRVVGSNSLGYAFSQPVTVMYPEVRS